MKHQTIQNASREIVPGENDDTLLSPYWKQVREKLFPLIQEETGLAFTQKLKSLAQILEIVRIEQLIPEPQRGKRGGQEIDRRPLARAFVAKAFFNLSQTRALKEQLDQYAISVEWRRLPAKPPSVVHSLSSPRWDWGNWLMRS